MLHKNFRFIDVLSQFHRLCTGVRLYKYILLHVWKKNTLSAILGHNLIDDINELLADRANIIKVKPTKDFEEIN